MDGLHACMTQSIPPKKKEKKEKHTQECQMPKGNHVIIRKES